MKTLQQDIYGLIFFLIDWWLPWQRPHFQRSYLDVTLPERLGVDVLGEDDGFEEDAFVKLLIFLISCRLEFR